MGAFSALRLVQPPRPPPSRAVEKRPRPSVEGSKGRYTADTCQLALCAGLPRTAYRIISHEFSSKKAHPRITGTVGLRNDEGPSSSVYDKNKLRYAPVPPSAPRTSKPSCPSSLKLSAPMTGTRHENDIRL